MCQHAPAANPNQPHKQHPAGHVTPGGRVADSARSSHRFPLILHCFFTLAWVSKDSLRAETLGWSLIADAIWRRGSGTSKHTQTFTSRSLLLTPGSRWLPWKCAGIAALSRHVRRYQAAPELSNTFNPFLWSCLHPGWTSNPHHQFLQNSV